MKPFIVLYVLVVLSCGLTHSYSAYGGSQRYNRGGVVEPIMPIYTQQQPQQHYQQSQPQQYLPAASYPQPHITDDYNYNSRNQPIQNPNNYYYYPRQDYGTPLYGIPTYRGDYQPKPYYFAQPSYSSDDRVEATNPLDYLHEEILQENERERSMNNAAFMQNLALYNKQVDSLHGRQQQLQQLQDLYNLKVMNDPDDYDVEQPNDWYDQTSILVDPGTFENYKSSDYDMMPQANQYQQPYQPRPSDYDDEMVKELRDLTKQNRKSSAKKPSMKQAKKLPPFNNVQQPTYNNFDWQQDMPQESDDLPEPEYEADEDDSWINWDQKRDIQPKKQTPSVNKLPDAKPAATTQSPVKASTENSKLIAMLHKGQKEVVLPRPATPVRRPFSEPIMKMMKANGDAKESEKTPPIYKTIKQIIDMEQNLSHVSFLYMSLITERVE